MISRNSTLALIGKLVAKIEALEAERDKMRNEQLEDGTFASAQVIYSLKLLIRAEAAEARIIALEAELERKLNEQ